MVSESKQQQTEAAGRLVDPEARPHCPPHRIIRIQGGARTITAAGSSPTTSAKPSKRSTTPADLGTKLSQLGACDKSI